MSGARLATSALAIAVLAYVAYTGFFFLIQRRITYAGVHLGAPGPIPDSVPGFERIWLGAPDVKAEAWYLPAMGESTTTRSPALIFTHGNAEFIDDWVLPLDPLRQMGVSLLLVEYPGYGRSEGVPNETTIVRTVVDAYDWLATRDDIDGDKIVAMGRSLGGGPAAALTGLRPVAALVLESTFTSVAALAWQVYRLPGFLARDRYDNRSAVASYEGPVLIFHGTEDDVIPYSHGQRLSSAAKHGRLVNYRCGHNDCPPNWDEYWAEMRAFLRDAAILPIE
ncbi:MAG: alpha/beta hydrolase [Gemmatimonadota bacterium]|nr:MAG: alpha/beta hydrolase [Gemmatimonadota bacterium]